MSAAATAHIKKQFSDPEPYEWDRTAPQRKPAKPERDSKKRREDYLVDAGRAEPAQPPRVQISSTSFCTTVEMFWHTRPCWMCGDAGLCGHREYEVALAYVEASQKGIRR